MEKEYSDVFSLGNSIDMSAYAKEKNGLTYLAWMPEWTQVRKICPKARFVVHYDKSNITQRIAYDNGSVSEVTKTIERPWFTDKDVDGTGWVIVSVILPTDEEELTYDEMLPILDFRNKPIPSDKITSADANKAIKRCFTKCCAIATGVGAYVYSQEDMPEDLKTVMQLRQKCIAVTKQKFANEKLKEATQKVIDALLDDWNGKLSECDDEEVLNKYYKEVLKIR